MHVRRTGMISTALATAVLSAALIAPASPAAALPDSANQAGPPGNGQCPDPDPATPKRQLRADWIASVENIDWPSEQGLPAQEQRDELIDWYDEAVNWGFNAAVVQVRPTADAFWPSPYEPWSKWLTGEQGSDPGYDPLEFAVAEAHARNLEFHAWFNPYRIAQHDNIDELVPDHPARQHPDWVVSYGGKLYYNPGIPEVREFVQDAIMHAVENYDIDAVHFDDYFYPYPVGGEQFDDADAYAEHGGDFDNIEDWRRNNVDLLISELSTRISEAKPWVKFGVSPFAVWRNQGTDPEGSPTTAGVQTYDDLYADTRKWVRQEWIDYIVPQVYWNIGFAPADYAALIPWWSGVVDGTDVDLYIGQANYKVGDPAQPPEWSDPAEMSRHLTFNRDHPQVRGDIYFSAIQLRENALGHMDVVVDEHYSRPALLPEATHLGGTAPRRPVVINADKTPDGPRLHWVDTSRRSDKATAFAVYRVDDHQRIGRCDLVDARNLITVQRTTTDWVQSFTDTTAEPGSRYTYAVTALDRLHTESKVSNSIPVRTR